jgi:hypothetical protein
VRGPVSQPQVSAEDLICNKNSTTAHTRALSSRRPFIEMAAEPKGANAMKAKTTISIKPLRLSRETILALDRNALAQVRGGAEPETDRTVCFCTTTHA